MPKFDDSKASSRLADLHHQEEENLVKSLAPQYGYEYINLSGYTINPEAVAAIPEESAKAGRLVGFELSSSKLSVAIQSPNDPKTQEIIENLQSRRYEIAVYMCSSKSLEHAWKRYEDINNIEAKQHGVFDIDSEKIASFVNTIKHTDDVKNEMKSISKINNARRISETLELIFGGALGLDASDVHIEPEANTIRLRYRLDGVLHDVTSLDRYIFSRLMSRLKLLSGMVINQKKEAQDGRFTFSVGDRKIEVRSSIIPGASGESIVMRLLDPGVASFNIDKLELNPAIYALMKEELKKPNGLIITTGPTGSGKTTALYAFLQETHKEGVKIITIENPVEYKLKGIVQTQTGDDYTFASGLRAVLRQDPDIIMVGEIRDREVAETAIHASQTGHLVFSTLHTNSAVGGFPRLIDLGVDPRVIGSSINVILGQRLLRLLCPHCKKAIIPTNKDKDLILRVAKAHPQQPTIPDPLEIFEATGCEKCNNSGYLGRAGIFEAIQVDEAVEEAVIRDPREHVILAAAKRQKIPTMVQDGVAKILLGQTSITELERVVELPRVVIDPEIASGPTANDDDFLSHIVE